MGAATRWCIAIRHCEKPCMTYPRGLARDWASPGWQRSVTCGTWAVKSSSVQMWVLPAGLSCVLGWVQVCMDLCVWMRAGRYGCTCVQERDQK